MDQPFDAPPAPPASPAEAVSCELSLADVIRLIEADPGLDVTRKRNWLSSLRRIAAGIGRPPASIPARLTSLRHPMSRLNAARMGVEGKSLSNHKANVDPRSAFGVPAFDRVYFSYTLSMIPQWQMALAHAARLVSGISTLETNRVT